MIVSDIHHLPIPAPIWSLRTSLPGELSLLHTHLALAGMAFGYIYYCSVVLAYPFSLAALLKQLTAQMVLNKIMQGILE